MSYNHDSSGSSRSSPTEWDILDSSSSSSSNDPSSYADHEDSSTRHIGGFFSSDSRARSPSVHPFEWTYNLGLTGGGAIKREWSPEPSFASRMAGIHFHSPTDDDPIPSSTTAAPQPPHDDLALGSDFWNTAPSTAVHSPARTRTVSDTSPVKLEDDRDRMQLDLDYDRTAQRTSSAVSPAPGCVDPAMTTSAKLPTPTSSFSTPVDLDAVNRGIAPSLTSSQPSPDSKTVSLPAATLHDSDARSRPTSATRTNSAYSSRSASSSYFARESSPPKQATTQSLVAKDPVIVSKTISNVVRPAPAQVSQAHLLVCGVPLTGAKSRVETQVKISLSLVQPRGPQTLAARGPLKPAQLMDADGELRPEMDDEFERIATWNHIQLPKHLALKKKNPKKTKPDPSPEETLQLNVSVVKASDPDESVFICAGCRQREVKRAQRKKDSKKNSEEAPEDNEPLDEALEDEKVVVFNATEFVEFENGQVVLPTRITCYCRHHKERIGFSISFSLATQDGRVLAQGFSPPIMITDDHKMTSGKAAAQTTTRSRYHDSTDGGDPDFDVADARPKRQVATRPRRASRKLRQMQDDSEEDSQEVPLRQVVAQQGSKKQQPKPYDRDQQVPRKRPSGVHRSPGFAMTPLSMSKANSPTLRPVSDTTSSLPSPSSSADLNSRRSSQDEGFSSSLGLGGLGAAPLQVNTSQPQPVWIHESSPPTPGSAITDPLSNSLFGSFSPSADTLASSSSATNPSAITSPYSTTSVLTAGHLNGMLESSLVASSQSPKISRLIPGEGPVHGGIEVTVLGENFVRGLVCVFGDSAAVPTHFWSSNTLVCVLPPSANPGPVVVGIKDVPLTVNEGAPLQLFTYKDDSDRSLLELALQVVGLKMTGRLEDASAIAMRIVGNSPPANSPNASLHGASPAAAANGYQANQGTPASMTASLIASVNAVTSNMQSPSSQPSSRRSSMSAPLPYTSQESSQTRSFEGTIIKFLSLLDLDAADIPGAEPSIPLKADPISHVNGRRHTLLHLATVLGFHRLSQFLIARGVDVDARDRNGYTALHFAALYSRVSIARQLVEAGADGLGIKTRARKTALDIARERDDVDVEDVILTTRPQAQSSSLGSTTTTTNSTARPSPRDVAHVNSEARYGLHTPVSSSEEDRFAHARSRNASMVSLHYLLEAEADVDAGYDHYYYDEDEEDYWSTSEDDDDFSSSEEELELESESEAITESNVGKSSTLAEPSSSVAKASTSAPSSSSSSSSSSTSWMPDSIARPARRFSHSRLWERVSANVAAVPRLSPRSWRSDSSDAETIVPRSPPPAPPSYATDDEFDSLTTDEKLRLDFHHHQEQQLYDNELLLSPPSGLRDRRRKGAPSSLRSVRNEWTIEEEHVPLRNALRNDKMLAFFWLPILILVLGYCSWHMYATWPAPREHALALVGLA